MSDSYYCPIHEFANNLEQDLLNIVDEVYRAEKVDDIGPAVLEQEKTEVIGLIKKYCPALFHKLELLTYKLQIIENFDWQILSDFDEAKKQNEEGFVLQTLQGGKLKIACLELETMKHFIYSEISGFFSVLSSVIDICAEIISCAFRLNVSGDKRIEKVVNALDVQPLKSLLENTFCNANKNFYGMRIVRRYCEHKNHLEIINIIKIEKHEFPRSGEPKIIISAHIKKELLSGDFPQELANTPDGDTVSSYCTFLYKKINEALKNICVTFQTLML